MVKREDLIYEFSRGIAKQEGFYNLESLARRLNNPGAFRRHPKAVEIVKTPKNGEFARFATVQDGWAAVFAQVDKNVFKRGLTWYEFFAGQRDKKGKVIEGGYPGYCPSADPFDPNKLNKPGEYAQNVLDYCMLKLNFPKPKKGIHSVIKEVVG